MEAYRIRPGTSIARLKPKSGWQGVKSGLLQTTLPLQTIPSLWVVTRSQISRAGGEKPPVAELTKAGYNKGVKYLTVQEKRVLVLVACLLAIGWMVKIYRAAHPAVIVNLPVSS